MAEVPAGVEIGPITAGPNGDVYFSTATQIFRLPGGSGPVIRIAGTGEAGGGGDGGPALNAQLSSPHGLAVAADGSLLVSDRDNNRIRRIDPVTGVISAFAQVGQPYGLDVGSDGTVYVVEGTVNRVVRLSPSGARLGFLGPAFPIAYDVEAAPGGSRVPPPGRTDRLHPPDRARRHRDDRLAPLNDVTRFATSSSPTTRRGACPTSGSSRGRRPRRTAFGAGRCSAARPPR